MIESRRKRNYSTLSNDASKIKSSKGNFSNNVSATFQQRNYSQLLDSIYSTSRIIRETVDTHSRETRHSQPLASQCRVTMLRDIAILWDVMEFQDGRWRADRWARGKRNSISLADRLLRPRTRAPPFIPEISIREHVDIERTRCRSASFRS